MEKMKSTGFPYLIGGLLLLALGLAVGVPTLIAFQGILFLNPHD